MWFPKLKLPPDLLDVGFSIATGPSFDDYDLDGIPENHPRTYGCGFVYRWKWPANFIVSDFSRWRRYAVPYGFPTGLTVWSRGNILDRLLKLPSSQRPAKVRAIEMPGGISSTTHLTTHVALQDNEKAYLLGADGAHSSDWTTRRRSHATPFIEQHDLIAMEDASRCTTAVLFSLMTLLQKGYWDAGQVVNLSTTSCMFNFLPACQHTLDQPFGTFDRYTKLVAVYVGRFDSRLPCGLLTPMAERFIRTMQEAQADRLPKTPIAAVCDRETYTKLIGRLDDKEVLLCKMITPAIRCQFTHVIEIGGTRRHVDKGATHEVGALHDDAAAE